MSVYKVINNNLEDWHEAKRNTAGEVMDLITNNPNYSDFEIFTKSPLTGEYISIIKKSGYNLMFNTYFKIPGTFKKLI